MQQCRPEPGWGPEAPAHHKRLDAAVAAGARLGAEDLRKEHSQLRVEQADVLAWGSGEAAGVGVGVKGVGRVDLAGAGGCKATQREWVDFSFERGPRISAATAMSGWRTLTPSCCSKRTRCCSCLSPLKILATKTPPGRSTCVTIVSAARISCACEHGTPSRQQVS